MELRSKIVYLTIFTISSTVDVWQGPKYNFGKTKKQQKKS